MEYIKTLVEDVNLEKTIILKFLSNNLVSVLLVAIASVLVYKYDGYMWSKPFPPGPIGLPFVGWLPFLGDEPHVKLLELSKKYGRVMSLRLGKTVKVIITDFDIMKSALSHPAALDRAPHLFDHIPRLGMQTANGPEWVEQRRFSIYSMRNLGVGRGAWGSLIMEEVNGFLDYLSSTKGTAKEVTHRLNLAVSNNILSLLIGRRLQKGTEDEKIDLIVNYADVAFTYMGVSHVASLIPGLFKVLEYLKIAGYDRAMRIIAEFAKLIRGEITNHKSENKGIVDFMTLYLNKKENMATQVKKHYFSDENLEGNSTILFLGASDTILSSLGWLFRLMAHHPDIQKKVQEEVDDVLGRDGEITYEERVKIPYTFAVMMEAQRYSSIVPLSTTRIANEDFEIDGYHIPKGTELFANLWAMHFDPEYWPEPNEFRPERFLKGDMHTFAKTRPSYAPFSVGRRNCPGETIAWMEILLFFTSVMQRFTITTAPGEKANFEIVYGLVTHLKHQHLCFIERTDNI